MLAFILAGALPCGPEEKVMKPLRLLIVILMLALPSIAQENRCNDIVGTWKWFVGPELVIKADHTFSNGENSGTWEVSMLGSLNTGFAGRLEASLTR